MSRRRHRQAGFTLLEMMVALVAGAIAIATIYYISAASSWHFQEQQRVAQTQMNLRMAMEQVRRDIALAGYLGTPNSAREQRCVDPTSPIQAISLTDGGSTSALPEVAANPGVEADTLRLTGNYVTSDAYLVNTFGAAGNSVDLQRTWQAFRRTFGAADAGGYDAAAFEDVFRTGRWLHITTQAGYHMFVQITGQDGATASITFTPSLPLGTPCVPGLGTGATVAPLTRIEYVVLDAQGNASLASLQRSTVVEGGVHPVLVRREISVTDDTVVPNSERIVAEYVAHFDVDFVLDTQLTVGAAPTLQPYDDTDAQTAVAANPHHVRSALVELRLRGPREDPRFNAPPPHGYELGVSEGTARVRGMHAQVLIPNIANRVIRP